MKTILVAGSVLIAMLVSPAAAASASPVTTAPDAAASATASIGTIAVRGTGCSNGSYQVIVAPAREAFTATFSEFVVSAESVAAIRKNCLFAIDLQPPSGYAYKTVGAAVRGWTELPAGITLREHTTVYFQGSSTQAQTVHTVTGPFSDATFVGDNIDLASLGAPCGQASTLLLNADVELPLAALQSPEAYAIVDTLDANFTLAPCTP